MTENQAQEIDLTQFDDDYKNAEVEEKDFEPVPDGTYQVNIERVEITTTKNSHKPMLTWMLRILAPKCQGRVLYRNSVISANTIKYLKADLFACGLRLGKISDLPDNLSSLLDVKLEIFKKTKGDNENIYINRKIDINVNQSPHGEGEASNASNPNLGEDDIPF